jgi:uncharacterized protein YndB with AHSA1/START domain
MSSRNGQRRGRAWRLGPDQAIWWTAMLERFKRHAEGVAVPTLPAATAEVVVDASPDDAFRCFTEEIGLWWRRGTPYWNDAERGLSVRIEPGVGGRFIEVYDLETGAGYEVGRVTVWDPGRRFAMTWTQVGWPEGVSTDVEVTFEPERAQTRVTLRQTGFERVGPGAEEFLSGYTLGWKEVLGWFAAQIDTATP